MTKLSQTAGVVGDAFSALLSLCIMACLVLTALGIKIKWFKHRLNFEQQHGRGHSNHSAQYHKVTETQIRQPVQVHGVFRKRVDEDIELERPTSLPPIRIKRTTHGKLDILPPKKKKEDWNFNCQAHTNSHGSGAAKLKHVPNETFSNDNDKSKDTSKKTLPKITTNDKRITDPKSTSKNLISIDAQAEKAVTFMEFDETNSRIRNGDLARRRPTGYVRPILENTDNFSMAESQQKQLNNTLRLNLNIGSNTGIEFGRSEPEIKSNSTTEPPKSVASEKFPRDEFEADNWSAIQRHRYLTQAITKEVKQISLKTKQERQEKAGINSEAMEESEKRHTMRDMQRDRRIVRSEMPIFTADEEATDA